MKFKFDESEFKASLFQAIASMEILSIVFFLVGDNVRTNDLSF